MKTKFQRCPCFQTSQCLLSLFSLQLSRRRVQPGYCALPPSPVLVTTTVVVTAASRHCRPASEKQRAAPARSTPAPLPRAPARRRSTRSRRAAVALSAGSRTLPAFPLVPWSGLARRLARRTFVSFMLLAHRRPRP